VRDRVTAFLKSRGIAALSHYVPLHSSKAGRQYTRTSGQMTCTDRVAGCLLRLPLHVGLQNEEVDRIIDAITDGIKALT
jgi:dTDP-4-amino-4,6-dideoxygalactose transaminase